MTSAAMKNEARESLLGLVRPGYKVYTIIRSVSASGMSRTMSLFVVKDGELVNVTFYVARVLGYPMVDVRGHRALRVSGVGMDMAFHVTYNLGRALFADTDSLGGDAGYLLKSEII